MLRVVSEPNFIISMDLDVDWEKPEITVKIQHSDRIRHEYNVYEYPADEFSGAIKKFEELENQHRKK